MRIRKETERIVDIPYGQYSIEVDVETPDFYLAGNEHIMIETKYINKYGVPCSIENAETFQTESEAKIFLKWFKKDNHIIT